MPPEPIPPAGGRAGGLSAEVEGGLDQKVGLLFLQEVPGVGDRHVLLPLRAGDAGLEDSLEGARDLFVFGEGGQERLVEGFQPAQALRSVEASGSGVSRVTRCGNCRAPAKYRSEGKGAS
jgi:hypothetical protein